LPFKSTGSASVVTFVQVVVSLLDWTSSAPQSDQSRFHKQVVVEQQHLFLGESGDTASLGNL
jgi:hypothetical protein